MTITEHDRRKRQMNRRIREVLAVRRTLALDTTWRAEPAADHQTAPGGLADEPAA